MKKSHRLKTIVDLKAAQEQECLEAVGAGQRKLAALQAQVDNLKLYRRDYQDKFNKLGSGGANVGQLLEFRLFMDKLDKAVAGQEHALDQCKTELAMKKKIWENTRQRSKNLAKIHRAALENESRQEGRAEQLEQDERASRLGRNSANGLYDR